VEPYCTEVAAKPPYSASSAHGTTLADYPVWEEEVELQKEQEEVVGTLVEEDSE
jgi:hypothetical protein